MKNFAIWIDLAFCLIVLPVMAAIFPIERWLHNFPGYVEAVGVWLYCIYFINRWLTVPWLFRSRRFRIGAGAIIAASFVVTSLIARVYLYTPHPNAHNFGATRVLPAVQPYQQAVWSLFVIVLAFSFAVGLLTQINAQRARSRAIEAEREHAELELYKAQIKPHFMFNTLNTLYGLFLTGSPSALASLEEFISMVRYMYTVTTHDFVPLSDEIDYIRRYVELQSMRLNDMTKVDLKVDVRDLDLQVPPMLLVTFVENCFKHGVSSTEPSHLEIAITERDGTLRFGTRNRIFPFRRVGEHSGIENCRRRLQLLYPARHTFEIDSDGNIFNVNLSIQL